MNWTEEQLADVLKRTGTPGLIRRADTSNPPFKLPGNAAGAFALGRLPVGTMNKTEAAYEGHLRTLAHRGEVLWHKFEGLKLRLADNTFYTCDFAVLNRDCALEMHEVKGFWQDDARVKIKVAASLYPFRFFAVTALSKKKGGGWHREEF
ncbi:MAG: DUF1064 domain-containing protein [Nitrobacter sp.]